MPGYSARWLFGSIRLRPVLSKSMEILCGVGEESGLFGGETAGDGMLKGVPSKR